MAHCMLALFALHVVYEYADRPSGRSPFGPRGGVAHIFPAQASGLPYREWRNSCVAERASNGKLAQESLGG